jgi:hypothetical protein
MSLSLACAFGLFKANITGPPLPLRFAGQPLGFFIERASRGPGTPGIQMATATAYSPGSIRPASSVTDLLALQVSLASMLRNPVSGRISRVGVIYADRMAGHPGLLGLMFDRGFSAEAPAAFTAIPREGCAVFLEAIAALRPVPEDFVMETLFTTAHEVGHVFNLWHVDLVSFLKTSRLDARPFGVGAYRFVPEHAAFLRNMDQPEVFPGGTPFGVRGVLGPTDDNSEDMPESSRLRLNISMTVREFWRFEPVELLVRLSAASSSRSVVLPDAIDPGYECFDVWIAEPDGRRQRYRSPAVYCCTSGTIAVTREVP